MAFRGDRLRAVRKKLRLSQAELGSMVGLSQKSVSDLENGATMETTKLHALAQRCGVSPDWLLGLDESDEDMRATRMLDAITNPKAKTVVLVDEPENMLHPATVNRTMSVPEYDVRAGASYGGGINDEEHREGGKTASRVVARWGLPNEFVESELGLRSGTMDIIKVRGDSMDDGSAKGLSSGDRVIVDHEDRDVRQGGIFVVFDGMGTIIKQVELDRDASPPRIICKSLNPRYSPIILTLEFPVEIKGRVAARISRM
ncbi:XRE family transcriptional regulator [Methylobacterium brachiatum]